MASTSVEKKPIVLAVDDDPHILMSLERSMRRMPWRVLTAANGQQALDLMATEAVAVVIADYQMPGMDGVTFLNRVKRTWPNIKRVMLTGAANLEVIEQAVNESEVNRFLNKPWSDSQLKATVLECLEHARLEEINRRYERMLAERNKELETINRELERKVEERTEALLHSEKMAALGRMAGGVAHEINNPLGGILAFVQVLLRDLGSNTAGREALEAIQTCAIRCKTIVDNLLSFSRKPTAEALSVVSLNEVADVALTIAQLHPRAKDVNIKLELVDDPQMVYGQASLLQQVVVNLLQNSFQASQEGDSVIIRTLERREVGIVRSRGRGHGNSIRSIAPYL